MMAPWKLTQGRRGLPSLTGAWRSNVREQISLAPPMVVLRAVRLYCCDHYGSMLWDLEGNMANQYFNVWG